MSIKGSTQTLYVGKEESNIIGFLGKKITIDYSDLSKIDFCYFKIGKGGGYLDFVKSNGATVRFSFNHTSNEKISRTIDLIHENVPDLEIVEHSTDDLKFYQCDWFIILMLFICCFPLGIFLMWYNKKYDKFMRILLTFTFIFLWSIAIYTMWPRTYEQHITLDEYNQCQTGMSYRECMEIIGGEGEPLVETNILDITSSAYIWYGDDSTGANATMYFTNDALTSKAQIGLQ